MKVTDRAYDAIVVGAGFGGSTCAALLAKRGLNVLLLEKNSRAGGKAMTISKRGFTHELWPVISAPAVGNLYEAVLREVGADGKVELLTTERQGSIYISPAGELKRFPYARTPAPDQLFDLLEVPEDERPEALRLLAGITLMELPEIQKLDDVSFHDWLSATGRRRGCTVSSRPSATASSWSPMRCWLPRRPCGPSRRSSSAAAVPTVRAASVAWLRR